MWDRSEYKAEKEYSACPQAWRMLLRWKLSHDASLWSCSMPSSISCPSTVARCSPWTRSATWRNCWGIVQRSHWVIKPRRYSWILQVQWSYTLGINLCRFLILENLYFWRNVHNTITIKHFQSEQKIFRVFHDTSFSGSDHFMDITERHNILRWNLLCWISLSILYFSMYGIYVQILENFSKMLKTFQLILQGI